MEAELTEHLELVQRLRDRICFLEKEKRETDKKYLEQVGLSTLGLNDLDPLLISFFRLFDR